jgi:hypothetical protein
MGTFSRIHTIADVARAVALHPDSFDQTLREFLDSFYAHPSRRPDALAEAPQALDPLRDAYLAATAEHLAQRFRLPVPLWSEDRGLDLQVPHFAGGLESLKATLIQESPLAFRRRLIFISRNALDRPRLSAAE